ncbi:MAG: ribonuclease HI family protein [Elusimicrobiaceae bacterium]|nr:ribonuclease HI family protein [Elusimicrobiaceae bacterium]
MLLLINIDGGSRGNPGIGASGVIIKNEQGKILLKQGLFFTKCTNNQAEYNALKLALISASKIGGTILKITSDSELLVKQFNGVYKIKNPDLKILMEEIKTLVKKFKAVTLGHTLREGNSEADEICNLTMDAGKKNKFENAHLYTLFQDINLKNITAKSKQEESKQLELFDL